MPTLRQVRTGQLLTMRELAERAGVAPSTVYLVEAGRTRPSLRVIRQLSTALGVEPQTVEEFRVAMELAAVPEARDTPS